MQYLYLAIAGNLFAIFVGVYLIKCLSLPYRLTLALLCIILFCEVAGHFSSVHQKDNAWVFNSFYLMPELWLTGLTGWAMIKSKLLKIVIPLALLTGTFIWFFNIFNNGIGKLSSATLLYAGVCLTIIFLVVLVSTLYKQYLFREPAFWLSISVILYFSCNIPLFGMYNFISSRSPELLDKLYYINNALVVIRYPLVALAFYFHSRQRLAVQKAV